METIEQLTKLQIKALRIADHIGFYRTPTRCYIKATRRVGRSTDEVYADVACRDQIHAIYGEDDNKAPLDTVGYCSHLVDATCGSRGRCWRTIAGFLQPGDVLALDYYRDAESNNMLLGAELHGDRLTLVVERIRRGKKRLFEFVIQIGAYANDSARLIRRGRYNNE